MKTQPTVREFQVEELVVEWIPKEHRQALIDQLSGVPGGTDRLAEITQSNEAILEQYPPRVVAAEIAQRYRRGRQRRLPRRFVLPALGAVSAAAVLIWITLPRGTEQVADPASVSTAAKEHILVKGTPQLIIHRLEGAKAARMHPGQAVEPGDRLQIAYNAAEARYGVVFSVDGRGAVTLHHPSHAGDSTALTPGGVQSLPFSFELDDTPGFERFFLVWSRSPIAVDAVLAAAKELGTSQKAPIVLPDGVDAAEILLLKRPTGRPH